MNGNINGIRGIKLLWWDTVDVKTPWGQDGKKHGPGMRDTTEYGI